VWAAARPGQALVETALVVPLLLLLAFGVVGVGRVTHAQLGVSAVAREAARAAALADTPGESSARGLGRGQEVAAGYGLANGSLRLTVEPGSFARGGQVRASASYAVSLDDLPLLGWARIPVVSDRVEPVDLYRSRWRVGGGP
jgi:Flp pilus assembly protein TadG